MDLRCGDKVPADCRLAELASTSIRLEESQLTGESVAVLKVRPGPSALSSSGRDSRMTRFSFRSSREQPLQSDGVGCFPVFVVGCFKECEPLPASLKEAELQAQRCMVFSSTSVVSGHGLAVVVKTGMHTQIGKIQAAVQEADESEDARSPLHLKLEEFGETLSKVIFAICGIVWLINIGVRKKTLSIFELQPIASISLLRCSYTKTDVLVFPDCVSAYSNLFSTSATPCTEAWFAVVFTTSKLPSRSPSPPFQRGFLPSLRLVLP